MKRLMGSRVLVVEDEALIAAMIVEWLGEMGCEAVGPAARISEGLAIAEAEPLDAAVLDVNVNAERIFPLADRLRGRGVALVFATGYGECVAEAASNAPVLEKPFTFDQLSRALTAALGTGHRSGGLERSSLQGSPSTESHRNTLK